MKKVLITPKSFMHYKSKPYEMLREAGYEPVENRTGRTMTEEEIIAAASEGVSGIIVGVDPLPARVLDQLKDVRAISKYGMGVDNIDVKRAEELGIKVSVAHGTNNISVAELAIALLLAAVRHIPKSVGQVKSGQWVRTLGWEITGKRIGVIGGGQIGREVAIRAQGLKMKVKVYDPFLTDDPFFSQHGIALTSDLDALLAGSDVITLHIPANPATRGLINKHTLARMKQGAILINTARGELVNEDDLYEALVSGQLACAAQDVFSSEPPLHDHRLLKLDNFILTAHTGAYTHEAIERMAMISTMNLLHMLDENDGQDESYRNEETKEGVG